MNFDEIILNRVSSYLRAEDLVSIFVLMPSRFRNERKIDDILSFMPEYYFKAACRTKRRIPGKEWIIARSPGWNRMYTRYLQRMTGS